MERITLIILEIMIGHFPRFMGSFKNIFGRKIRKEFSNDVSCEEIKDDHYIKTANGSPFYFVVRLSNKSPISFFVKSLYYKIEYNFIPLQVVYWKKGEEFASNGLQPSIKDLLPKAGANIDLPFNPVICLPSLPEDNKGWSVNGFIELECPYYSSQSVHVSINNAKISGNYEEVRRKYWETFSRFFKPPPPPIVS